MEDQPPLKTTNEINNTHANFSNNQSGQPPGHEGPAEGDRGKLLGQPTTEDILIQTQQQQQDEGDDSVGAPSKSIAKAVVNTTCNTFPVPDGDGEQPNALEGMEYLRGFYH